MKCSMESFPAANMKRLFALCKFPRDAEGKLGSLHVGLGGLHSQHTASSYSLVFKEEAKFNNAVWLVGAGARCLDKAGSLGEGALPAVWLP